MEAAIHVKPFGFDRIFHMSGADTAGFDGRALNDRIDGLLARIAAMEATRDEELARAGADAFEAGLAQARQERGAALLAATDAIHAALEQIDTRLAETAEAMTREAADVALAAADMLAGHAIDHAPVRTIGEALERVLRQVTRGTRLGIRVHPALLDGVERMIGVAQQDRRRISITAIADDTMPEGDALIFWDEGGLAIDAAARRKAVLAELRPFLAGAQPV